MDLLIRLRANTLWPAMHKCSQAFWDNKDNLPIAKKYDIVLGSSHCEQMLRDNEWEWRRYEYHDPTGAYTDTRYDTWNYNSDKRPVIQQYWRERVQESKGFEAMYTLGMRGVHDWGISGYPSTQDKVDGLTDIIGFQRQLLADHIGDPTTVPQIFIPYKEVLEAYNAGLQVPEDVTLTWVDDNHGYVRQLPTPAEQSRSGGNGIYYHISYWGTPHDYLWLCTHSPALISYELSKAYDQGIRNLWIVNVGDIKPAEAEMQFAMDLAWDVDRWGPLNAYDYTEQWAALTFGDNVAKQIADIKNGYYLLAQGGRPEHVFAVNYTHAEMNSRIYEYKKLVEQVDAVKSSIRPELSDAFFQLIEYPVKGACYMNVKTFRAKQSLAEAEHGQKEPAITHALEAHKAYNMIESLTDHYNRGIAHGKWNKMMSMKPRELRQFDMPATADAGAISEIPRALTEPDITIVKSVEYEKASPSLSKVEGLGVSGASLAVWPVKMNAYKESNYKKAPVAVYKVPVKKGTNKISARFLPTFPVNGNYDLRVGMSINGDKPTMYSLKTEATKGKWNETVLQGYNDATITYEANADGEIILSVYFMDPALALSDIYVASDC